MDIVQSTYESLPHIEERVIECDLRKFTRWLNALLDRVNWLTEIYVDLKKQVDINTEDIRKIKITLKDHEDRITNLEKRVTKLEETVENLDLDIFHQLIEMVNGRVDLLYKWLPIPYGMIDPLGWKFAMGNINAMSTTDEPNNINGPGIYTSGAVEDNDINFK